MNLPLGSTNASDDDGRFDRLVDGELSPEEYRALMSALDEEPGGWRRCALAFLEAQALGQELLAIRRDHWTAPDVQRVTAAPANAFITERGLAPGKQWLAMAASFLVALSIGIALPGLWKSSAAPGESPPHVAVEQGPQQPPPGPTREPREVASARLVLRGPGGASEAGEVPIYEFSGDAGKWLGQQGSALPVTLVNELARAGHQVQRQQQFVPVDLEDGRRGLIPVETIQITPVSRRAY